MKVLDYWWIAVCAVVAGNIAAAPSVTVQLWLGGLLVALFILVIALDRTKKPAVAESPTTPRRTDCADHVRDVLEGLRMAGFSEEQAQQLAQESMRTAVKQQGGWKP